jgi:hypothetical protein
VYGEGSSSDSNLHPLEPAGNQLYDKPCLKSLLIIVGLALLAGCAAQIKPPPLVEPLTLQSTLNQATELSKTLHDRVVQLETYDVVTGVGLLAAGIAGLALGVFDGSREAILGAGVAGAAILGIRAFVPFTRRKVIFTNAQAAIDCSLNVLSFGPGTLETPGPPPAGSSGGTPELGGRKGVEFDRAAASLTERLREVGDKLDRLSNRLRMRSGGQRELSAPAIMVANREIRTKLAILQDAHRETTVAYQNAVHAVRPDEAQRAQLIHSVVRAVIHATNKQLNANGVDPQAAVRAAHGYIGGFAESVRATALDAQDKARRLAEKATETKITAETVADTMPQTNAPTLGTPEAGGEPAVGADAVADAAAETKDTAQAVDKQMAQILRSIAIPSACFEGLLPVS